MERSDVWSAALPSFGQLTALLAPLGAQLDGEPLIFHELVSLSCGISSWIRIVCYIRSSSTFIALALLTRRNPSHIVKVAAFAFLLPSFLRWSRNSFRITRATLAKKCVCLFLSNFATALIWNDKEAAKPLLCKNQLFLLACHPLQNGDDFYTVVLRNGKRCILILFEIFV